ncbi:FAD:protein FMN transferase [Acaricomes phytoseiuli]|uniref:FAD:protein FMN transferase n=1 Tax=Acaricomes phytoseiuli TaxID=291968 RepID=UPI000361F101|nr:FAD:protein FMN transferase [Acaricomes phytoseiuli]MCW1248705.1 FAD:protein FMN transferase [Acaricomes phytoseiuli]
MSGSSRALPHRHEFEAIGTLWQIDTERPLDAAAQRLVASRIDAYDAAFSRFRSDSLISRAATQPGTYELPAEAAALCELYRKLFDLTDGALTPLLGDALAHWGYDPGYSLRPSPGQPQPLSWPDAIDWQGTTLRTLRSVTLDIGAAGKGQLVDLVGNCLVQAGYAEHIVDAGGDLRIRTAEPVRIALEHPYQADQAIGVITMNQGAICASAANRRAWGDGLHHILDGRTGHPVRTVVASWVIASSALLADALATALFCADPQRLAQHYSFAGLWVHSDGSIGTVASGTSGVSFDSELFTTSARA